MTADFVMVLSSLALGVGLAAAAGMRVFVPLLIAGLAIRFDLFPQSSGADAWLASTPALIALTVATIAEVAAYKVPFLDNILDAIGAPAALVAGVLLTSTFLIGVDDPFLRTVLTVIAGAGAAGTVHAGTAAARLLSTKTTGGLGNPVVAGGELAGSIVTSILAFIVPIVLATLILVVAVAILIFVRRRRRAVVSTLTR